MGCYIGIDPGVDGAWAIIGLNEARVFDIESGIRGKKTRCVVPTLLAEALRDVLRDFDKNEIMVLIEDVHAMPAQGVSSVLSLGHTSGIIEGVVATLGLRYERVRAAVWKKAIGLPKQPSQKAAKEIARSSAIRLYPSLAEQLKRVADHNRAEALLIARYCQQEYA